MLQPQPDGDRGPLMRVQLHASAVCIATASLGERADVLSFL